MSDQRPPIFLERRAYRLRRLADGARMLPIIGGVLFLLPLLWADGGEGGTARTVLYLFIVWLVLILAAALLSRGLHRLLDEEGRARDRLGQEG